MVKFLPIGFLDINTDPSRLPGEVSGKDEVSGAMRRCTNLNLDETGVAKTRDGSSKVNASAVAQTAAWLLEEMGGIRYLFSGTVLYRNEASIATELTSAKWGAIQYNSYNDTTQQIFALNGTNRKRISGSSVNEWGLDAPTVAPILAIGALTGLTGDYNAKYTYVRKVGTAVVCESNPSPAAAAAQGLTNQSLSITCTAPLDTQVTHIRVYRTLADGGTYYYDSEITLPTVVKDTNTADTALGTEVEIDHYRPPLGTVVVGPAYNGYCFILKDNLLYFCKANRPEYWPLTYYIEVGHLQRPLKAAEFLNGLLYAFNEDEIYLIQGTGYESFFPFPMSAMTGALSHECVESVKGKGIFHVGRDGIYLFTGSEDLKITEAQFDPIFNETAVGSIPAINQSYIQNSWLIMFQNKLYFGYPKTGSQYPDNILVINLLTNKTAHYDYSQTFRCITIDRENNRLLAVDGSGYIWHLEDSDLDTDVNTAIAWQIESKSFADQLYKYFPRSAKYDVDLISGSANAYILLGDEIKQTHSLNGSRITRKRLITSCTGDRLGVRITGSGQVTIREVEIQ